jgi:hypothetical protein
MDQQLTPFYASTGATYAVQQMRKDTAAQNEKYLNDFINGPKNDDQTVKAAILYGIIGEAAYYISPDEINNILSDKNQLQIIMDSIVNAKTDEDAQAAIKGRVTVFKNNNAFVENRLNLINKRVGPNTAMLQGWDEYELIWDDSKFNQFMTDDGWAKIYLYKSFDQMNHPTRDAGYDYVRASEAIQVMPIPVRNGS